MIKVCVCVCVFVWINDNYLCMRHALGKGGLIHLWEKKNINPCQLWAWAETFLPSLDFSACQRSSQNFFPHL